MGEAKFLLAAVLVAGSAAPAAATDLIRNGGFETGDLSHWELSGSRSFTGVSSFAPHDGVFAAFMGPYGANGSLAQTVATEAGATYEISFWLRNEFGGANLFQASFDGAALLLDLQSEAAFPFRHYSFVRMAGGDAATLRFTYRNDPSYWHLDGVSVTRLNAAIPEPAGWATMIAGFGLVGAAYRRRRTRAGHLGLRAVAC